MVEFALDVRRDHQLCAVTEPLYLMREVFGVRLVDHQQRFFVGLGG